MTRPTKPSSSPSRSKGGLRERCRASRGRGVAFLILMMILTLLLISMTVALPDIYTKGQREREEELIFRGNQYARAIMLYHRQFNRFPTSVQDMIKKTNGYRFLRQAYPDPMTRSGKWRFIHANAAGVIIDSKTLTPPAPSKPAQGGFGASDQGTAQVSAPAGQASQESSSSPSGSDNQGTAQLFPSSENSGQSSSGSSFNNQVQGAFIVGVASLSKHKSIRVLNNHDRYDEWEFLGVGTTQEGAAGVQPGTPSSGGQPGAQPFGMGNGPTNPSNPQP